MGNPLSQAGLSPSIRVLKYGSFTISHTSKFPSQAEVAFINSDGASLGRIEPTLCNIESLLYFFSSEPEYEYEQAGLAYVDLEGSMEKIP